ncbi:potassium channel family protein [Bacillus sp. 1P06AnD]|uniref:potassium channel family protein n=1 Tax=Bacillus sp. 1P06AnD TaxID=3132208 RepID=UPI0039A3E26F
MKKSMIIDLAIGLLSLLSLLLLLDKNNSFLWINKAILLIFFIYVLYQFCQSENKWAYIKSHPLEIIALIPLNEVFQGVMVVRVFRMIVVIRTLKKHFPTTTAVLTKNGLNKVLTYTLCLIILAAIPIHYFEEGIPTFADGIWWAIVTATTVGYGDISPVTVPGRITAVILMFSGIGCIGMITGTIASYFTTKNKEDEEKTYMKKKIDQIEKLTDREFELLLQMMKNKRIKKEE